MRSKKVITASFIMSMLVLSVMFPAFLQMNSKQVLAKKAVSLPPREETVWISECCGKFTIFDKFNPFVPGGIQFVGGYWQCCLDVLYIANYPRGEIIKWLSTGWDYSNDYKTLTIHLRKGVTWSDGEPFTSADVAFTINMLKKNAPVLSWSSEVEEFVESVETPDDYTVVIHLKKPNPRFHRIFMMQICTGLPIVPEHIWKDKDPKTFSNNPPVTTGPYVLYGTIPDLSIFIWKRRDDWWGKKVLGLFPEPKYIIYTNTPTMEIAYLKFKKNEYDAGWIHYDLVRKLLAENPYAKFAGYPDPCLWGITFNTQRYPLNYSKLRWAFAYIIPYKAIQKIWPNMPSPIADSPFPAGWASLEKYKFADVLEKYRLGEYNPDKARELLDELNFIDRDNDGIRETPNGTKLSFEVMTTGDPTTWMNLAWNEIIREAKKVGIELKLVFEPSPTYRELRSTGRFEIIDYGICGGSSTIEALETFAKYHSSLIPPIGESVIGTGAYSRWSDPELDKLIDKAKSMAPDDPAIMDIYHRMLEIWMKNLPDIPVLNKQWGTPFITAYWDGWPSKENMYTIPYYWWGQFGLIFFHLHKSTLGMEASYMKALNATRIALENRIQRLESTIGMLNTTIYGSIATALIAIIISIVSIAYRPKTKPS